jgi:hypothetical protein
MTARATTETGAANLALGHLGQPALADLAHDSNTSLRARACRLFFGGARDAILREKWWSFAKGWVTPAADTVESLGPLKTRFVMPADCVRVRYIDGVDDEEWDLESGDVEDSAGVTVAADRAGHQPDGAGDRLHPQGRGGAAVGSGVPRRLCL